jgi:hypothetical protein
LEKVVILYMYVQRRMSNAKCQKCLLTNISNASRWHFVFHRKGIKGRPFFLLLTPRWEAQRSQ